MIVVIDLDGTISSDPDFYKGEMTGLRAQGHQVHVVTGNPMAHTRLAHLGLVQGRDFDHLATVPRQHIATAKVEYMKQVGASHLIDNRRKNIQKARKAGFTGHWHAAPKAS